MDWLFGQNIKHQLEELKQQIDIGNDAEALFVADGILDSRLKNYADLMMVARVYKKNGEYGRAKQLYGKAKEKRSSRAVVLELLDCCLELGKTEEAEKCFNELHQLSPDDMATLYAYRYKIEKCKKREPALLIPILEELKAIEYTEEYAYELAKQYHMAGRAEECMQECQEIILWFGEGKNVERAKTFLAYYKGEISFEEIRMAGERYVARQKEKEGESQGRASKPLQSAADDVQVRQEAKGQETEEPAWEERKGQEAEEPVWEERKGQEAAAPLGQEAEAPDGFKEAEEPLPEIDLSCLDFSEEEQNASREPYELYFFDVPEGQEEDPGAEHGKAERLLANKNVSIEETCRSFARVGAVRKQILCSLEQILDNGQASIFLAITGEEKTGKTTLALSMVKLLYRLRLLKYDRTAVIAAANLNQISIADKKEELKNCNLLIEQAGGLKAGILEEMLGLFGGKSKGVCLILEDTEANIDSLLRSRKEFGRQQNNRLCLPDYTAEELFGFAYDRIEAKDYAIDKLAAEALKQKIEEIVQSRAAKEYLPATLALTLQALALAECRGNQMLLKMASAGQFQTGNFFVLLKEDIEACTV